LLKFYDELPMPKEYWDVTQDDFQQLKGRFRGERGARKRGNGTLEEFYQSVGPPLKKTKRTTPLPSGDDAGFDDFDL
jgi:hypothetical protein